jgi:hypothetical protein
VASLSGAFTIVALLNGFIILIDCCYIFAFVVIYNYFRTQFLKIKDILYFFNTKWRPKKQEEQLATDRSESDTDEEDQRVPETPNNRKRKTTIDNNVSE